MLTIKKRYPKRKLYVYGGSALIVGFAGIMTFLVQTNTNLNKFVAQTPSQSEPVTTEVTQANEEQTNEVTSGQAEMATNSSGIPASNGNSWMVPTTNSGTSTQSGNNPATEQTVITPVTPTQPAEPTTPTTPTEPTDPPAPEPEDPGLIEEIVDVLIP